MEGLCRELLATIGEDPDREGLRGTPRRWADWWAEFLAPPADRLDTSFAEEVAADQMVVVSGIRLWTVCEHHLLPFWCDAAIAYIPAGRFLGLSKFARIARVAAGRLNLQERLAEDIARRIADATGTQDVAVFLSGEHLCMAMRGVRSSARMTTSKMSGAFLNNPSARREFFAILAGPGR